MFGNEGEKVVERSMWRHYKKVLVPKFCRLQKKNVGSPQSTKSWAALQIFGLRLQKILTQDYKNF